MTLCKNHAATLAILVALAQSSPTTAATNPQDATLASQQSGAGAARPPPSYCEGWTQAEAPAADETSSVQDIKCSIWQVVDNVRTLRDQIAGAHGHTGELAVKSHWQTAFDSTMILLGVGSVATAMYGGPAGLIGGFALAGTGIDRYRSYYNPEGQGAAYIKALNATRCVASTGEIYLQADPQDLWNAIASLKKAIATVQATSTAVANAQPTTPQGGVADASAVAAAATKDSATSQTSADAASAALDAANQALTAVQAESAALITAVSGIDKAHDAIKNYLDTALHRQTPSLGDVQAALNQGITAASQSAADTQTARDKLYSAVAAQAKNQVQTGETSAGVVPQPGLATVSQAALNGGAISGGAITGASGTVSGTVTAVAADGSATISNASLKRVDVGGATISASVASTGTITAAGVAKALVPKDFSGTTLSSAVLHAATITGAKVTGAKLTLPSGAQLALGTLVSDAPITEGSVSGGTITTAVVTNAATSSTPVSLQAAKAQAAPTINPEASGTTVTAVAQQNEQAVSNLIAATRAALSAIPAPQYTSINTSITACTAGLSS